MRPEATAVKASWALGDEMRLEKVEDVLISLVVEEDGGGGDEEGERERGDEVDLWWW